MAEDRRQTADGRRQFRIVVVALVFGSSQPANAGDPAVAQGDRREPWDSRIPQDQAPEGGDSHALNRPLRGLCDWGRRFPGLPLVALGYASDAHFVGWVG